jgi:DNA polymerase III subunit alpha
MSHSPISPPKRFVGLHSHSTFSTFDAIGRPQDHIDYALENNMDALALTDHGNMNGFSHQYQHAKTLAKKGVKFKPIFGVESYFIPSLKDWNTLYDQTRINNAKIKAEKDALSGKNLGNELASTEAELDEVVEAKKGEVVADSDDDGGTIVENEEESKSNSYKNPLYQRNHLVLLAKNDAGLKALFRIVSASAADGFYKYPRVDFESLKRHAQGNIIASSACLAGFPAKIVFDHQKPGTPWESWVPNDDNKEQIQTELCSMIEQFQDALGKENYNLEIQFNKLGAQHLLNYHLIEAAHRTGCPLVVTVDAHYSRPDHWKEREIYKMMGRLKFMKSDDEREKIPQKVEELKCELYPKNAEQVWGAYKQTTEPFQGFYGDKADQVVFDAIERTHDIAHNQIGSPDIDRSVKLPAISRIVEKGELTKLRGDLGSDASEDSLAFRELRTLAIEGLKFRKLLGKQDYSDRLKYELEIVKSLKFAKYFLTYAKIMEVVGEQQLIGAGRGSAAGSLLTYVLNITQVDPIKYGLLFARFLTVFKKGFPDIDSDFSDREQAVKILQEYFGEENVIPVSNFAQLQLASLCKDLAKIFGVPFEEVNRYTGKMRNEAMAKAKQEPGFDAQQWEFTLEVAQNDSPSYQDFMEKMEEYPDFKHALEVLFKQQRTVSRHAGGVIITDNSRENMPLIKAKGGLQTPWPEGLAARHLEEFGLLKFDILGLGTLRMFEDCIRKILKNQGNKYPSFKDIKKFYFEKLHPDNNDLADQKVYEHVYWNSNYAGVFQFVKPNVQKFMAEMKPTSILDIAIATSIHRPGPLGLQADKLYLANRKNPAKVKYSHPVLEEVLGVSSGLLIFQEQLQLIVNKLSGMPLEQTDSVRKAFTKKDLSNKEKQLKDIAVMGEKFVTDSMSHSGISKRDAETTWADFEKWTAYGFNLAHAVSYAITSYYCGWFLTYYPDEWITTYLDYCTSSKGKVAGQEDPKSVAMSEARALGYFIAKPDINFSEGEFVLINNQLIPSFASVKNVGKTVINELKTYRPYKSLEDLIINTDGTWRHSKLNKRALSHLIKLGAFESMELIGEGKMFQNYKQIHTVLVDHFDELKRTASRKKNNDVRGRITQLIEEVKGLEDWTTEEKMDFSKELSGSVDLDLILTPELTNFLGKNKIKPLDQFEEEGDFYWAIITGEQVRPTKAGKPYLRVKCSGESGSDIWFNIWGYKPKPVVNGVPGQEFKLYTVVVGRWKKNDFGFSTFLGSLRKVEELKV